MEADKVWAIGEVGGYDAADKVLSRGIMKSVIDEQCGSVLALGFDMRVDTEGCESSIARRGR